MLTTLIAVAMLDTSTAGPRPMACVFPAAAPGQKTIEMRMTPRPSLKDRPGRYRVFVAVDGYDLPGSASPIDATDTTDVLIRASIGSTGGEKTFYAVGFDDNGLAALNIVWGERGQPPERQESRRGHCRNYERYIRTWSIS